MTKINVIDRDGASHEVDAKDGAPLMETLRDADTFGVEGTCGGTCSCGTCHVFVDEAWLAKLSPMEEDEDDMLGAIAEVSERKPNSRLCCQIEVSAALEGLTVTVAPED